MGIGHTEETKKKMSETRKGIPVSAETREASRLALNKKVSVDGVEYESMKAVTIAFGITKEAVLRRVRSNKPKWKSWKRDDINVPENG